MVFIIYSSRTLFETFFFENKLKKKINLLTILRNWIAIKVLTILAVKDSTETTYILDIISLAKYSIRKNITFELIVEYGDWNNFYIPLYNNE